MTLHFPTRISYFLQGRVGISQLAFKAFHNLAAVYVQSLPWQFSELPYPIGQL